MTTKTTPRRGLTMFTAERIAAAAHDEAAEAAAAACCPSEAARLSWRAINGRRAELHELVSSGAFGDVTLEAAAIVRELTLEATAIIDADLARWAE